MNAQDKASQVAFACDLTALTREQRAQHQATTSKLFAAVQAIRELDSGYAFQLPQDAVWLSRAAEFIALERLCCPFFAFDLEVEPHGGPVWLRLTGREGIKAFILAELGPHLAPEQVTNRLHKREGAK
ncbi:MAG TPA: hypothetical protein VNK95_24360 [Caldilineaceae bacterium]|nr:hypothetical protein [Caldilineaceae bacterium]